MKKDKLHGLSLMNHMNTTCLMKKRDLEIYEITENVIV